MKVLRKGSFIRPNTKPHLCLFECEECGKHFQPGIEGVASYGISVIDALCYECIRKQANPS